jgi:hypothetical protein
MPEALALPYWFWGGICAVFSAMVLVVGVWLFWRTGPLLAIQRAGSRAARPAPPSDTGR